MAEELGRRLISENESNTFSLDEVLLSLRQSFISPQRAYTGISAIDDVVHALSSTRRTRRPDDTVRTSGFQPPIIQVDGIGPSSGKTQLLYLAAVKCLLGADRAAAASGAENPSALDVSGAVVWFDLPGTFSATRLHELLKCELQKRRRESVNTENSPADRPDHAGDGNVSRAGETNPAEPDTLLDSVHSDRNLRPSSEDDVSLQSLKRIEMESEAALSHIHVFRPQSTPDLIETLTSLPDYLFASPPTHCSGSRPLRLLVLAGLSTFWWQDRHDADLDALGQLELSPAKQPERNHDEERHQPPAERVRQPEVPTQRMEVADSDEEDEDLELDPGTEEEQRGDEPQPDQSRTGDIHPASTQNPSSNAKSQPATVPLSRRAHSSQSIYHQRWRTMTAHVKAIQRQFGCVVLASDLALARPQREGRWRHRVEDGGQGMEMLSVQPHLPPSWTAGAVTARLLLRRRRRRIPQGISLEEAIELEQKRTDEIKGSRRQDDQTPAMEADIMPNLWAGEKWSRETWQALEVWTERECTLHIGERVEVLESVGVETESEAER